MQHLGRIISQVEWLTLKNFLVLQGLFVVLAFVYLWRRKPQSGLALRFLKGPGQASQFNHDFRRDLPGSLSSESDTNLAGARELAIYFNFNGHTWEAFEVLGLPAGSQIARAEAAYQRIVASANPESHAFFAAALSAIKEHNSRP